MGKSPEAFRTISEVAEWLGVPTHVLRFWESRFPQVKPVKRAGGRRYYRPADMALLGGIRRLLHDDGMTIRGVQKLLREKGVKHVGSLSPTGLEDVDRVVSEARLGGEWPDDALPDAEDDALAPAANAIRRSPRNGDAHTASELLVGGESEGVSGKTVGRVSAPVEAAERQVTGGAPARRNQSEAVAEDRDAADVVALAGRRGVAPAPTRLASARPAPPIPLPPGVPEADPEDLPPAPHPRLIARLAQLTSNARVAQELARLAALRSRMAEGSAAAE